MKTSYSLSEISHKNLQNISEGTKIHEILSLLQIKNGQRLEQTFFKRCKNDHKPIR